MQEVHFFQCERCEDLQFNVVGSSIKGELIEKHHERKIKIQNAYS